MRGPGLGGEGAFLTNILSHSPLPPDSRDHSLKSRQEQRRGVGQGAEGEGQGSVGKDEKNEREREKGKGADGGGVTTSLFP